MLLTIAIVQLLKNKHVQPLEVIPSSKKQDENNQGMSESSFVTLFTLSL